MNASQQVSNVPKFHSSATYEITIAGKLHSGQKERLHLAMDEKISVNKEISTFTISIPDQAALAGILDTLYSFHITIIKVEYQERSHNNN